MDFGRIKNFESVSYGLPNNHKSVAKILGETKTIHPSVFVGGVLWADESFVGTIYPERAKPKEFVSYYTHQFNTIELNLSHYKTPSIDKLKQWFDVAPLGFKFCPKVHQSISHSNNLISNLKYHNACSQLFSSLGHKLGVSFLQLPPHFSPKRLPELLNFLDKSELRHLAIEIRHPDWFSQGSELNYLCNYLYKNNLSLVLTDTQGRRDVLHMRLTNKTAFIRFNANNNHPSDKIRITEWIHRINGWMNNGLETLYFFIHTPNQVYMPHLVTYFIEQLELYCHIKLNAPVIKTKPLPDTELF
jgi:uncharacterized protein YecE (DUF72 family)